MNISQTRYVTVPCCRSRESTKTSSAKRLNISRTPVREALIQLTAEGVLENRARKGFVIKSISEKDVGEIYAVIGVLDGYAAKSSCDHLTKTGSGGYGLLY